MEPSPPSRLAWNWLVIRASCVPPLVRMLKCKENRLRDQGQHTHSHHKVGQKLVIRKLLIWKKPPEVLEEKECAEKAGVDTKILHTKKKVQKYKMTLRVNIFTRILLP